MAGMAEKAQDGVVTRRQAAEKMGVTQTRAIKLLKQPDWHDLGPTFASEQNSARCTGGGRGAHPIRRVICARLNPVILAT